MLRMDQLFENFEQAKACLKDWEVDAETMMEDFRYFRVSSNAVYPFRQNGRWCFLRIAPEGAKTQEEIIGEVEIIRWLRGRGISAMEPAAAKDGAFVKKLDTPWGRCVVSCFYRVPGRSLEDTDFERPSELLEAVQAYGASLGRLHAALTDCPYADKRESYTDLLNRAERRLQTYHAPAYMSEECSLVRKALAQLPVTAREYGLVHYDFEADNVFYAAQTGEISIIDFDDMITCWYALDVVRALDGMDDVVGDLETEDPERLRRRCCDAFLKGYRSEKTFTEQQEESLPLMRRLVRISEYAGLLYTLSPEIPDAPQWVTELRQYLEGVCRNMEEMTQAQNRL